MLNAHPFLAGDGVLLMAHRGGAAEVAENSAESLDHVRAIGLTYVETDAHATADGEVVLLHDPTLERTLGIAGAIADMTFSELAERAGEACPVRLEDALERYEDLKFNVDAKADGVSESLARIAARHPERVGLASFSDRRLAVMRQIAPDAATSVGMGEAARLLAASKLPLRAAVAAARRTAPGAARAVSIQVPPRHKGIPVVTRRLVALAHELGLAVHVWDVENQSDWDRMLGRGVDGLITDYPTAARDHLQGGWR